MAFGVAAASTLSERIAYWAVRIFSGLVLLFLIVPILTVIPLSFNAEPYFSYPMSGLSLRWYEALLSSPLWRSAFLNSFIIGIASTLLATTLGTLGAIGLDRPGLPFRGLVMAVIVSPMIVPIIVVAVGLYLVFAPLGLAGTYSGVIIAHTALGIPFVVVTVSATLLALDRSLLRAAAGLGAAPLVVFRRITLPLILPGVVAGAVFAFATSLDEVVIILFVGGVEQRTIPRQMWNGIRDQISPVILAAATLLTLLALALYLVMALLRRRTAATLIADER